MWDGEVVVYTGTSYTTHGEFYCDWIFKMEDCNDTSIADKIKKQGDIVRKLKEEKADKIRVRYFKAKLMR